MDFLLRTTIDVNLPMRRKRSPYRFLKKSHSEEVLNRYRTRFSYCSVRNAVWIAMIWELAVSEAPSKLWNPSSFDMLYIASLTEELHAHLCAWISCTKFWNLLEAGIVGWIDKRSFEIWRINYMINQEVFWRSRTSGTTALSQLLSHSDSL